MLGKITRRKGRQCVGVEVEKLLFYFLTQIEKFL